MFSVVEKEVAEVDARLKEKQEELHILLNYKVGMIKPLINT